MILQKTKGIASRSLAMTYGHSIESYRYSEERSYLFLFGCCIEIIKTNIE